MPKKKREEETQGGRKEKVNAWCLEAQTRWALKNQGVLVGERKGGLPRGYEALAGLIKRMDLGGRGERGEHVPGQA